MAILLILACGDDENNPQGGGTNPSASVLTASVTGNTASLIWTQCPDDDFASYVLYRSLSSGIAANPSTATIVATITTQGTLTHTDSGLSWNTPYYYAVQTVDSSQLTAWSNEATITTADSSGGGGSALSCYEIQGQADESPYNNDEVTVTGIVTAAVDEFYAGPDSLERHFAVLGDPAGGEWSGLILFGYEDDLDNLDRGDSVVVSGKVSEYYGLTELVVSAVDFEEAGHTIPAATSVPTGEMSQEKWEGVFISFQNITVTSDPNQYGEFYVDDGSGDAMADDKGMYGFSTSEGTTYSEMKGIVFYEYNEFRIDPRDENDITQ